jgi:hypothetical protein
MRIKKKPIYNPKSLVNLKKEAGPGRPVGSITKASKTMRDTIQEVWLRLQVQDETNLFYIANEDPKWFYELCRGMFPKDLFVEVDLNLNLMSPEEIRKSIVNLIALEPELIEAVQAFSTTEET